MIRGRFAQQLYFNISFNQQLAWIFNKIYLPKDRASW